MTREEIVKALRCCNSDDGCRGCPLEMADLPQGTCVDKVLFAASDMLEQDVPPTDMIPKDYHDRCMEMEIERRMLLEQNAPKWISVKERMPESGEKVIVFAIGKYKGFIGDTVYAMSMILDRPSGKCWAVPWQYFDVDYEITHWMPMPEPPKEGK